MCSGKENCQETPIVLVSYKSRKHNRIIEDITLCKECFTGVINSDCSRLIEFRVLPKQTDNVSTLTPAGEEKGLFCEVCSSGLSAPEIELYGSKCVFCNIETLRYWNIGLNAMIYGKMCRMKRRYGSNAGTTMCGVLGSMGYKHINELNVFGKIKLLFSM